MRQRKLHSWEIVVCAHGAARLPRERWPNYIGKEKKSVRNEGILLVHVAVTTSRRIILYPVVLLEM